MAYTVVQKVKGNFYLYEVEGYWDPEKKQARQRRKYLGRCDEEGNLLTPKTAQREISLCKTFGPYYLLLELANQCGLYDRLTAAHEDEADFILSLAILQIVHPSAPAHLQDFFEESFLPELLNLQREFSPQELTEFLTGLAKEDYRHYRLCRSRAADERALIFDLTAPATDPWETPASGRDYHPCSSQLMNMSLVCAADTALPIFYKFFSGRLRDTMLLSDLAAELASLGISQYHFLLDGSFFSESNLRLLAQSPLTFTLSLPLERNAAAELLSRAQAMIRSPQHTHVWQGEAVSVYESTIDFGKSRLRVIVCLNYARETKERSALYARIAEAEEYLNGREYDAAFISEFREHHQFLTELLSLREADGKIVTRRREAKFLNVEAKLGRTILLTTSQEPWAAVLSAYQQRSKLEIQFRVRKSRLESGVSCLASPESWAGQAYLDFIALILRTALDNRLRQQPSLSDCQPADVLNEMSKLKIVKIGEDWRLSALTPKQKEYCRALKIALPVDNY